jgi:hypothetical protein
VTTFFRKTWRVQVDTMRTDAHDIAFEVVATRKRQPNTCTLKIWNLSENQRQHIESLSVKKKSGRGKIRVQIEAGWNGENSVIFSGDLRTAVTTREGPDLVTTIEGDDGGRDFLLARVSRSFPAGTSVATVIRALVQALGVGEGNLSSFQFRTRAGATFPAGTVLTGKADLELTRLLHSCGMTWSVQNGALQILEAGKALATSAVLLRARDGLPMTGLLETPSVDPDGTVNAIACIMPGLQPGGRVQIDCPTLQGLYQVHQVRYVGDTAAEQWDAELECKT